MRKLNEQPINDLISEVGTEVDRIKVLNEGMIKKLDLKNVLEGLKKRYFKDGGYISKPKKQIYVKTFKEDEPFIVDFIYLYRNGHFFIVAVLGEYLYITSLKDLGLSGDENATAGLLEKHLIDKNLLEEKNLNYFEDDKMISIRHLVNESDDEFQKNDIDAINNRFARVFFETFLKDKVLTIKIKS